MKKLSLFVLSVFAFIQVSVAQQDPKAGKILDDMSNKYQSLKAYKADFAQTLENQSAGIKETMEGQITVMGNKFRLKMAGQEIINNGKTIWTYMKDVNEVNVSENDPDDEGMSPTQIYNMYKKGYKYVHVGQEKQGANTYDVIELSPEDRNNSIFKVRLMIDVKDKTLKSWKMFKDNGNRYTYTIKNFVANPPVTANDFTFDKTKYKGVQVIDLR